MPPKKSPKPTEPEIVGATAGRLCIEDKSGAKVDRGLVEAKILRAAPFEYYLQIFRNNDLLISQEIDQNLDFDFRIKAANGESRTSWLLMREDGSVRLLELRYTENAAQFKLAISIALYETSFQQSFDSALDEDDKDWAAEGIAGADMGDEVYQADYEMKEGNHCTMNDDEDNYENVEQEPTREQRIKALKRAQKKDSDEESESEEEEQVKKPAKKLTTTTRKGKMNATLETGTTLNRTYVTRAGKLGVFGYDEDDQLTFLNAMDDLTDQQGNALNLDTLQLHDNDRKILIMDNSDRTKIHTLDLEAGQIVETLQGADSTIFNAIAPRSKYAQTTNEQTIVGTAANAVYTLDPRVNTQNKIATSCEYKTNVNFTSVASDGQGYVATASKNGDIRLYSKVQKNYCKTLLPGLGHEITGVDVTEDGSWMVATTDTYLLVIPLLIESTGKTGFEARMGKEKPTPMKLSITPQDRLKYGIEQVRFTKAKFNTGTVANTHERWIATSTGQFVITFDFTQIKKGKRDAYKITDSGESVVRDVFRHNHQNEVIVAQSDDVFINFLNGAGDQSD